MVQKSSGPKTRLPKEPKSSSSAQQDDIEIEIAEVLFGLMQQSHNPKKEADNIRNTEENAKSEGVNCISQDNKSSVSLLSRSNSPSLDLLHGGDSGAYFFKFQSLFFEFLVLIRLMIYVFFSSVFLFFLFFFNYRCCSLKEKERRCRWLFKRGTEEFSFF